MGVSTMLKQRREEREALLQRIVTMLKEDRRVCAAWLGGSLGRGDADNLSDIDLYIVVADAYAKFLYAARRDFVRRVEGVVLIEEAPQIAPPEGAYLLTLYQGETGPHQVDWYWQMESVTTIPAAAQILFNPRELPQAPPEMVVEQPVEQIANRLAFFWAMVGIAAKKIARRQIWAAINMLSTLQTMREELAWEARRQGNRPAHGDRRTQPPPIAPEELLEMLTVMAAEMAALHPKLQAIGVAVPEGIHAEMQVFLTLTGTILSEK